ERRTHWGVATEVTLREDDAAIALSADRRSIVAHADRHVDFADRRTNSLDPCLFRYVLDDAAGREVGDDRALTMAKHQPRGESQREILADRLARIRHELQPVHIRIHCEPQRRAGLKHEPFQVAEVFGDGFGRARKAPVRLEIDRRHPAAQPIEQRRHDHRAGATHAVERNGEPSSANPFDIDVRYRQNTIDVSLNCTVVDGDRAERIPTGASNSLFDQPAHLDAFAVLEKETRRPDELERVPLDWVVARRDHEAPRRVMVLDGELAGGRRGEPDVDHVATDRLQCGEHDAMKHRSGYAAVPPDDYRSRAATSARPGAETGGISRDDLWREPLADSSANPRHTHHQPISRHPARVSGGRCAE